MNIYRLAHICTIPFKVIELIKIREESSRIRVRGEEQEGDKGMRL